jgi:transposase
MNGQLSLFQPPSMPEEELIVNSSCSKPRLNTPIRNQVEFVQSSLDDLIPEDHQVRSIWDYISQMDLSPILIKIKSTADSPGRPAIDPRILLALWIYAIKEGIGSARLIERYCSEHLAFRWLCGGVSVNYHTISDFRRFNSEEIDELIAESITRLASRDLISFEEVSQDGMRVQGAAGTSSCRRKPKLKELHEKAKQQVKILRKEIDENPTTGLTRQTAAKKRAVEERQRRVGEALKEHKKMTIEKGIQKKKQRKPFTKEEKKEIRASTTDPEVRKMKMANGGFNYAYNMQLAVDTGSQFIIGWDVINKGHDYGQLQEMFNQVKDRYGLIVKRWLVDQGYIVREDIIKPMKDGCKVYVNPKSNQKLDPGEKSEEILEWRKRMETDEAKKIYKNRASTSEFTNAGLRKRGLVRLLVRGIKNVKSMLNLHVMSHNVLRAIKLGFSW